MLRRWYSRLSATIREDSACVRLVRTDLRGRRATLGAHEAPCSAAPADVMDVIAALDSALHSMKADGRRLAGLRCDVAVNDAWMIYEVIEGDLEDMPRRAADALVGAALADTAGAHGDQLAARWQSQGGRRNLACALPQAALKALQGVLHRHGVRLGAVEGALVHAYNARRHALDGEDAVLAVPGTSGTQLALVTPSGFAAVSYESLARDPGALFARTRALMRSAGYEPTGRTRYFADETLPPDGGATPWRRDVAPRRGKDRLVPWLGRERLAMDLSPSRPAVRAASWALLGLGVLAFSAAALQFQTASGRHLQEARALQGLEASLTEAREGRKPKLSPDEARNARASATVQRELQVPWAKLFGALEAVPTQHVALLSVEPSAQRGELKLVAEARSSAAMFDFLEALRAQRLRDVALVSHEVQARTPGAPIRFQARAAWDWQ